MPYHPPRISELQSPFVVLALKFSLCMTLLLLLSFCRSNNHKGVIFLLSNARLHTINVMQNCLRDMSSSRAGRMATTGPSGVPTDVFLGGLPPDLERSVPSEGVEGQGLAAITIHDYSLVAIATTSAAVLPWVARTLGEGRMRIGSKHFQDVV